jgi:caffeic acid 3-O-methyltransferase
MDLFGKIEIDNVLDNLQSHAVLEGVQTLVDVGGGNGGNVAQIIAKYPHIKGINFDIPPLVAHLPELQGVTHVGGNMFESVPSGDAVYLKWVLHNHGDGACITLLKNCFKALPKHGKVIIVEYILTEDIDPSTKSSLADTMNLVMLGLFSEAKERTTLEYKGLLKAAGFSRCQFIQRPNSMDLIVGFKE